MDCYSTLIAKTTKISMQEIAKILSYTHILDVEKANYWAKFGSTIYIIVKTWIDIAFFTIMISQFAKNSNSDYFYFINQILQNLARSYEKNIIFIKEKS